MLRAQPMGLVVPHLGDWLQLLFVLPGVMAAEEQLTSAEHCANIRLCAAAIATVKTRHGSISGDGSLGAILLKSRHFILRSPALICPIKPRFADVHSQFGSRFADRVAICYLPREERVRFGRPRRANAAGWVPCSRVGGFRRKESRTCPIRITQLATSLCWRG